MRWAGAILGCVTAGGLAAGDAVAADDQLYAVNCAVCHLADGSGIVGLAPPLKSDVWKRLDGRARPYLAGVMLSGLAGVQLDGQHYAAAMPPWAHLSDADLAAIGSFVLQNLNREQSGLDAATVAAARAANRDNAALRKLRAGDDS